MRQSYIPGLLKAAEVGVRTISAPRALRTLTFSLLIFSGITITHLWRETSGTTSYYIYKNITIQSNSETKRKLNVTDAYLSCAIINGFN